MTSPTPPSTPERPLSATRLAQYVTVRGRCERYLRLALFPSEGQAQMRRYGVTPEALSPLLAEAGSVFEHAAVGRKQRLLWPNSLQRPPVSFRQARLTSHFQSATSN